MRVCGVRRTLRVNLVHLKHPLVWRSSRHSSSRFLLMRCSNTLWWLRLTPWMLPTWTLSSVATREHSIDTLSRSRSRRHSNTMLGRTTWQLLSLVHTQQWRTQKRTPLKNGLPLPNAARRLLRSSGNLNVDEVHGAHHVLSSSY